MKSVFSPLANYKTRRLSSLYGDTKQIYRRFMIALSYGSPDDIDAIRKRLRHFSVSSADLERKVRLVGYVLVAVIFVLYLAAGGATVIWLAHEVNYPVKGQNNVVINLTWIVAGSIVVVGLYFVIRPLESIIRRFDPPVQMLMLILTGFALIIPTATILILNHGIAHFWPVLSRSNPANIRELVVAGSLALAESIAGVVVIIFGGVIVSFPIIITPLLKRRSDVMIVNILVELLKEIESKPLRFGDVASKARICRRLQNAASYLQYGILRALDISDLQIKDALQERLRSSAMYLREMQLWVVLANDKTPEDLSEAVAHYINAVVQGKYDLLPTSTTTAAEHSKVRHFAIFIRTFIVAVIPIGCVLGVRYAGLSLSSEFTDWAIVISIAWAAITMISLLDPLYKTRLIDIRDFISSIRGGSG